MKTEYFYGNSIGEITEEINDFLEGRIGISISITNSDDFYTVILLYKEKIF